MKNSLERFFFSVNQEDELKSRNQALARGKETRHLSGESRD